MSAILTMIGAFLAAHGIALAVGVIVVVLLVLGLSRLKGKADQVGLVLKFLSHIEGIIKAVLPEKWQPVYDAIIAAGNDVASGTYTHNDATAQALKLFDAGMVAAGVTLSGIEATVVHKAIELLIDVIYKDKVAAAKAFAIKDTPAAIKAKARF